MDFRATTILAVKKDNTISIAGDGQVTLGSTVVKSTAKKIRRLYNDKIIAGFAGAAADAFTLFDKFEIKLDEHAGNLRKSAVELAKEWRNERGSLDAMLLVADKDSLLIISGSGDVLEPDDNLAAIGSGGNFAYAAAKALYKHSNLSAEEIAIEGLKIAGDICIYTNTNISVETINKKENKK